MCCPKSAPRLRPEWVPRVQAPSARPECGPKVAVSKPDGHRRAYPHGGTDEEAMFRTFPGGAPAPDGLPPPIHREPTSAMRDANASNGCASRRCSAGACACTIRVLEGRNALRLRQTVHRPAGRPQSISPQGALNFDQRHPSSGR